MKGFLKLVCLRYPELILPKLVLMKNLFYDFWNGEFNLYGFKVKIPPPPLFRTQNKISFDKILQTKSESKIHICVKEDELAKCIEESRSIWEQYHKYFDLQLTVESFDHTYRTIKDVLSKMSAETQWVPLSWVYS